GGHHRGARVTVGHPRGRRDSRRGPDDRRLALARLGRAHRASGLSGGAAVAADRTVRRGDEAVPGTPPAFAVARSTLASRIGAVVGAVLLVALATLPLWGNASLMRMLIEFISLLVLAQMWNLLAGYAGLVSIGQQAYVGLGGYALVVLADDLGVNPFLAVPLAGLVAAAFALPTAALVFRFRAASFAVWTWAVAEVYRLLIANTDALGRGTGRTLKAVFPLVRETREGVTYAIAVTVGVAAVVVG